MKKSPISKEVRKQLYVLFEYHNYQQALEMCHIPKEHSKIVAGYYGYYKKLQKKRPQVTLYPMRERVKQVDTLWAHKDGVTKQKGKKPAETLMEHSSLTLFYFNYIVKEKGLQLVIQNFKVALGMDTPELSPLFDELLANVFFMHDTGKININFQLARMENPLYLQDKIYSRTEDSSHALTSAIIYIDYFYEKYKSLPLSKSLWQKLASMIVFNAYIINKHHGHVIAYERFEQQIITWYETRDIHINRELLLSKPLKMVYEDEVAEGIYDLLFYFNQSVRPQQIRKNQQGKSMCIVREERNIEIQHIDFTYPLYAKLIHSLLVACDYYATSEYMTSVESRDLGVIKNKQMWSAAYNKSKLAKAVAKEEANYNNWEDVHTLKTLNEVRTRACAEVCHNFEEVRQDAYIQYIEAPTGIGKSHIAVRLALKMLDKYPEMNKVHYIFPFNSLANQTDLNLDTFFEANPDLQNKKHVINSVTPMRYLYEEDVNEQIAVQHYTKSALAYDFMHYEWILTSHVQFFNALFSPFSGSNRRLYQFANSIIILDEIQAYANHLWPEISHALEEVGRLLNIKFIIMSATLPFLSEFTKNTVASMRLLGNKFDYYNHPTIKDRVTYDYSLMDGYIEIPHLLDKVIEQQKTRPKALVEFITKSSAMEAYRLLITRKVKGKDGKSLPIMLITGDDSKLEQKKIISRIKTESEFILLSTQVIEAGVDIDCDCGFKNYSLFDCEYQFAGRINRNNRNDYDSYPIYFFNLDLPSVVYKKDYRCNKIFSLLIPTMQQLLNDNNFDEYYYHILRYMMTNMSRQVDRICGYINDLNTFDMYKHMQLIQDHYPITVCMNITLEIDGKQVTGKEVWEEQQELRRLEKADLLNFHEAQYKHKEIQQRLDYFCYNVADKFYPMATMDEKSRFVMYIDNAEPFFTEGKFDRQKLDEQAVPWTKEQKNHIALYGSLDGFEAPQINE